MAEPRKIVSNPKETSSQYTNHKKAVKMRWIIIGAISLSGILILSIIINLHIKADAAELAPQRQFQQAAHWNNNVSAPSGNSVNKVQEKTFLITTELTEIRLPTNAKDIKYYPAGKMEDPRGIKITPNGRTYRGQGTIFPKFRSLTGKSERLVVSFVYK
jgi:hypothetical protein